MIDIGKIEKYHFYDRYGIADLIFMYSKYYNISIDDVIKNKSEEDLIDYYNKIYRIELCHKFRLNPTLNIIDSEIKYDYIGDRIFENEIRIDKEGKEIVKYYNVSDNGLANYSKFLSPHIISSSGQDCVDLFNALNKEINKDGNNNGAISPFVIKVVNKYKQEYNKFSKLELIGQIIATVTPNKLYYIDKDYKNAGTIPDFKNLYDYFKIIEYTYDKNNITKFITTIKDLKDCETLLDLNKKKIDTRPSIILNGNIDRKMNYPFGVEYIFIDLFIEYCNKIHNRSIDIPQGIWYSISVNNIKELKFSKYILDTSINHELTFREFSRNLLADNSHKSKFYKYLFNFYKSFEYKDFKFLLQKSKSDNNILIKEDNQIIIKFLKTMNKNDNEIIKDMIRGVKNKIFLISHNKCVKLGYDKEIKPLKYKENSNKFIYELNNTIFNYINTSNSIEDLLLKISKLINKYKVGSFIDDESVKYLLNDLNDFNEFKKVACIYLYTKLENFKKEKEGEIEKIPIFGIEESEEV